jgi:hypothetical protein
VWSVDVELVRPQVQLRDGAVLHHGREGLEEQARRPVREGEVEPTFVLEVDADVQLVIDTRKAQARGCRGANERCPAEAATTRRGGRADAVAHARLLPGATQSTASNASRESFSPANWSKGPMIRRASKTLPISNQATRQHPAQNGIQEADGSIPFSSTDEKVKGHRKVALSICTLFAPRAAGVGSRTPAAFMRSS